MIVVVSERGLERALEAFAELMKPVRLMLKLLADGVRAFLALFGGDVEKLREMFEEVMAQARRQEYFAALARPQFAPAVQRVRAGGVREPHDRRTDLRNRRPHWM